MAKEIYHDVLILGAGLAGLRAAVEISRRLEGKVDIGIVSKVQLMRAHSVCAEGGTAAVLRPDEGDSLRPARLGHRQGLGLPRRPGRRGPLRAGDAGRDPAARPLGHPVDARRAGPHRPAAVRRALLPARHAGRRQDRLLRDADALRHAAALPVLQALRRVLRHRHPGRGRTLRRPGRHPRTVRRDGHPARQGAAHRHRRRRHAVRLHHLLADGDRRRHGDGVPRRAAAGGHGVPAVPPHRARALGHPHDRGVPRRGRLPEEQQGRALHGATTRPSMELAPRDMVSRAETEEILAGRGFPSSDGGATTCTSTSRTSAPTGSTSDCR